MKKGFLLVVCCLLSGWVHLPAARAQADNFAQRFYGMWYTYPLGNPNTDPIGHEFRHNADTGQDEMVVTRICPGDYHTVTARAVSPIEISENTIKVLKSASGIQEGEGNSVCRASIDAAVLSYTFSEDGSHIIITNPGGNPDMLELARRDQTSDLSVPANLYGSWALPAQEDKDKRIEVRLVFYKTGENKGMVRQIMSCYQGTESLLSQVDSPINVNKDQITILDSASHEERYGPFTCTATLTPGTFRYVISPTGATMTLAQPRQKPLLLTREH